MIQIKSKAFIEFFLSNPICSHLKNPKQNISKSHRNKTKKNHLSMCLRLVTVPNHQCHKIHEDGDGAAQFIKIKFFFSRNEFSEETSPISLI